MTERARVVEVDLPGARVAFSSRIGGVSDSPYDTLNLGILTGDRHERVLENRTRLTEQLGLGIDRVAMGWQVHGADVLEWDAPPDRGGFAEPGAELEKVDGHVTDIPELALLVLVADCLPVALAGHGAVAMLHAGWRGLAAGVLEEGVRALREVGAEDEEGEETIVAIISCW